MLAVTKIRFRRFRRFSKVCQEPFPAFEQVSSQKVESIQKLNFRLGIKIVQLWPWFNSFDTGSPSVTNIQFRRFSKVNQEPFPAFELVSSQKVESIQWYIRGIGTTKIFVVYYFLMQFLLWFFFNDSVEHSNKRKIFWQCLAAVKEILLKMLCPIFW